MKTMKATSRIAAMVAVLMLGGAAGLAGAAAIDLAQTPLASSSSNLVKPNVSFVLDTSGSMAWSHAPDESQPWASQVGYKSSQCNSIYYNPNIIYPPPRNADGTSYPNASFSAAWKDGFYAADGGSSSTVNLGTGFYAYDNTSSFGAGTDTLQPAYYYNYLGSQVATGLNYQNSGSQFYKECNADETPTPTATITFAGTKNTSVTSITVNGTNIMSGSTAASTSSSTLAGLVAAKITVGGYSATASGSTVTISGPISAAGVVPVITTTPPIPNATITFSGTQTTSVTGITVNGIQITTGPSTASNNANTEASNVAAVIGANGYSATVSGAVVTIFGPFSAAGFTPVVTSVGNQSATITFSGSNSTAVSAVRVNGVNIMSGATTASTSATTVASNVAAKITAAGYSATAASGVVTITGPSSAAGFTPVVTTVVDAATTTLTVTGSGSTSVTAMSVNGTSILSGPTSSNSNTSTVASRIAANITLAGYSATSSTNTVTITGPASAVGFSPAITQTGGMSISNPAFVAAANMTVSTTTFSSVGVMGAAVTAFPPPGTMTATPVAFSPFNKVIVSSTSGPGSTDERQNFANWFSYYRIRVNLMKAGAGRAFVGLNSNYRIGFMTIYTTPSSSTTDPGYLAIGDYTTAQKTSWFTKLYSQTPGGGTPLKQALSEAARNIAGKVGPDPQQYSCQQNFIILTTDGYWNAGTPNGVQLNGSTAVGNQDNNTTNTPPPMYDGGLGGSVNTLADVAAYYYNTDLRPSTGACNTGVSGADVCADNVPVSGLDNAPHQHITLFTLGLGTNGQLVYDKAYLTGGSADYNAIVAGSKNWPVPVGDTLTTIDDLWHAAVNGHGQYFSAKNPDLLVSGLQTALAGVSAREAAGAAAATSNLEPVAGDNFAFVANYRTQKWDGDVQARSIDVITGAINTVATWSAQTQLDTATSAGSDTRTIFTFLGGAKTDFVPGSFSAAQKTAWFTPTASPALSQSSGWVAAQTAAATADNLINYLRGQFGNEERGSNPSANQIFRAREHVLGDIINGKPVYVKVPPFNYTENSYQTFKSGLLSRAGAVYVAANDGMLHAIDASTGNENWAYIPSFVLPNLKALADDNYPNNHRYFVDGSPVVSDIWTGSAWKTILVAGLNGGGKGYYALDITNPATPAILWEYSETNLGFTYGNPIISKLADGTWVVVFTSGYNSADGVGRLYVIDANTGVLKFTVSTGVGTAASPSGLGAISGWVDNGLSDNTLQRVYGGDMLGNLWRFDVNNTIPPTGREATQLAFFQVGTYQQPITARPELGLVNNKPVIFIGTGRYLGASDLSDLNQQSFYAIRDDLTGTGIGNARTETTCPLVQQTLTVTNANTRTGSANPVDFSTKCGWYVDFNPGNTTPGERVNVGATLQLGVVAVGTNIPLQSVCTVGGSSFLYFFDYATGGPVNTAGGVVGQRLGNAIVVGEPHIVQLQDGRDVAQITLSDDTHPVVPVPQNTAAGAIGKRVLWRELLN
ncbi:MAG: PilC/PilY family type IV pilus protein [Usitatibacter sp.]